MRITAVVGAALVAVAASALGPAPAAAADSAEHEIRAVLDGMNRSYNSADFAGFAAHVCSEMLRADGFRAGWFESRRADGPTRITVTSVRVHGDDAVATVRFEAEQHRSTLDVDFIREGGWKACRYRPGVTI
ncbi:Rv0361 family membrane protein [Mycolicibacterium phlei]